jgi:hypothetical protein
VTVSFSIGVVAKDKESAKADFRQKFEDQVIVYQAIHVIDRPAITAAVDAYVDFLADDPTRDVAVTVSGYLSWSGVDADGKEIFIASSLSVQVSHTTRTVV